MTAPSRSFFLRLLNHPLPNSSIPTSSPPFRIYDYEDIKILFQALSFCSSATNICFCKILHFRQSSFLFQILFCLNLSYSAVKFVLLFVSIKGRFIRHCRGLDFFFQIIGSAFVLKAIGPSSLISSVILVRIPTFSSTVN